MKWSELPLHPSNKVLRQFAAAWLVVLLAFGLHQWLGRERTGLGLVLVVLGATLGPLGLAWPQTVRWLFVGWMVLVFPIAWTISQLVLLILFYGVITPVALVFRWRGRDWLHRKPAPGQASFWRPKPTPSDLRSYFRQY